MIFIEANSRSKLETELKNCFSRNQFDTLALVFGIQVLGFFYCLWFLTRHGYLPVFPQFTFAALMDFFDPLYWSENDGRYTEWKSVYPPLNFLFLKSVKLILLGDSNFSNSFALRASAFPAALFFLFSYLIVPALVLKTKLWNCFNATEKILLYFTIILSMPMLFALQRGNLIIFTLIFIALALGKSGLVRAICIAVLINLKPYFALLLVYYLVRHNWKEFWRCTLATGMLFVGTGLLLDHNFFLLFSNMFDWSQNTEVFSLKEVMAMPSSISAFSYVLNSEAIQRTKYSHYFNLHAIANLIAVIKWFAIAWILVVLYKKQKLLGDTHIIAILLVVISNYSIRVGGYTLIFYITLLPVFLTMRFRNVYCVILILLSAPLDFIPLAKETLGEQYSYLTNAMVEVHWTLGVGSVLRPILNFVLMATLLYEISQLKQQLVVGDHLDNDVVLQDLKLTAGV